MSQVLYLTIFVYVKCSHVGVPTYYYIYTLRDKKSETIFI